MVASLTFDLKRRCCFVAVKVVGGNAGVRSGILAGCGVDLQLSAVHLHLQVEKGVCVC